MYNHMTDILHRVAMPDYNPAEKITMNSHTGLASEWPVMLQLVH
jgi:hypothetical protein